MKCKSAIAAVLWLGLATAVQAEQAVVTLPKAEVEQLLAAYALIKGQYVEDVDDKKLLTDAIGGMVAALDPHSNYLNKEDLAELDKENSGQHVGVGVEVEIEHGQIKVMALTEGGPAERAGILPGDSILSIDGVAVTGLRTHEVARLMRGVPGSVVKLGVLGQGGKALRHVSLARATLHAETVQLRQAAPGIAWIRISRFEGPTAADLVGALKTLDAAGEPKGLILDLRNDPGGLVAAAVGVAAAFLPPDSVLFSARGRMAGTTTEVVANQRYYRSPGKPDELARLPAWARRVPLTVLVNGASASAAELVAGALQDHGRAKVIGSQTFGKGSIQAVMPLTADSALKMTVARYYTPAGRAIQAKGITPDIVVAQAASRGAEANGLEIREADLAHHLPAASVAGEVGSEAGVVKRATAENTQMFGTPGDKTLQVAIATYEAQAPNGRPVAAAIQRLAAVLSRLRP